MLRIILDEVREDFLSYDEMENLKNVDKNKDYYTNCTCYFNFEYLDTFGDIILQRKNEYISAKELLDDDITDYTIRAIRFEHNIEKIFRADGFVFKKGKI